MRALQQLPRVWALQIEQEANHARLEEDLVLEDELRDAELEEPVHLAAELATMAPFQMERQDEATTQSWRLAAVPDALQRELDAFTKFRQEALNIHRHGAAVVPITCENDKSTALRLLGWLSAERDIAPGLGVFGQVELSQWVSDWVNVLHERGVKYSSLVRASCTGPACLARSRSLQPLTLLQANYTNSLISVTSFVYNTYKVADEIHALPTTPLAELVRLRGQCESEAKQERLYRRADPNFLEWEEANAARVKAEREYRAATGQRKSQLLRDWLVLSLHTIMPPDRVGIVRKLRLNMSLKRAGAHFVLDCTTQRSHKTSKL